MLVVRPEETTIRPVDTGVLQEKVMPFSQPIIVKVLSSRALELNMSDNEGGDVEIVLVINGIQKLKYRREEGDGYRAWQSDGPDNISSEIYYCPVSVDDTNRWRGLVQAYVKRISPANGEGLVEESPYSIIPLFIARQMPGGERTDPLPVPPPPPPPYISSIELAATAECSGPRLNLVVDAVLTNTSGIVLLEMSYDNNEWKAAQIFTGDYSRNIHWQPEIEEEHAPYGTLYLRMRDVSSSTLVSNLLTLNAPQCSFDRYELINTPAIVCTGGVMTIDLSLRYFAVHNATLQLECNNNGTWIPLTVLNTTPINDTGEIHLSNRTILTVPGGNYTLRVRNTNTQRYTETMVYIDSCN